MKKPAYIFLFLVFMTAVCFFTTCQKDKAVVQESNNNPPPPTPTAVNLIANGSFEDSLGNPSVTGWYINSPPPPWFPADTDSYFFKYINNAPPNGGSWSIQIHGPGQSPTNSLTQIITGLSGTNVLKLEVWAKSIFQCGFSSTERNIAIGLWSYPNATWKIQPLDTTKNSWEQYFLIDTLTTQASDSIIVRLEPASSGPCGDIYLFDKIILTKN